MKNEIESGWAEVEFADVDLGDKRRNKRLVHLCGRLSKAPESPINQACEDWSETKAAYRFFQNEGVDNSAIMSARPPIAKRQWGELKHMRRLLRSRTAVILSITIIQKPKDSVRSL